MSAEDTAHVGPTDLILQAIVPPTDAPAEIRAAVARALAGGGADERAHSWEDVSFAASALAFVEGTDERAQPDTQWVFALRAQAPRIGQQIHSSGAWASTFSRYAYEHGDSRQLWSVSVFDAITTEPRVRSGA